MKGIIKKFFEIIWTIVIIYVLFFGEWVGLYHSYKHHSSKDFFASIFIPPLAWYRSIEMFWHDYEEPKMGWDKRLKKDKINCMKLMEEATGYSLYDSQIESEAKNLAKEINKYPEDKLEQIRVFILKYRNFYNSYSMDCIDAIERYKTTDSFNIIVSDETKKIANSISEKFELKDIVEDTEKRMQSSFESFGEDKELLMDLLDKSIDRYEAAEKKRQRVYYLLFMAN